MLTLKMKIYVFMINYNEKFKLQMDQWSNYTRYQLRCVIWHQT